MSGVFVLIVVIAVAALLIASAGGVRSATLQGTYRRVAAQYHGDVQPGGMFGWPMATFRHRDVMATVRPVGPWGMRATQVQIHAAPVDDNDSSPFAPPKIHGGPVAEALSFTCEIIPAGFLQRMAYLVGRRKAMTDSPNFDLQYLIAADDPAQARRLLTRYVQVQIDRLRYFQGGNDVCVRLEKGVLTVSRRGVIRTERVLRQFVALVLELYEQSVASYAVGIDFVKLTSDASADAVCKICGDPLDLEEIVYCRVCDTPHHRECWRYFGGCSVYACGERRFNRVPRLARGAK